MEETLNEEKDTTKTTKTSSTDGKSSDKTTGDSQVQDGTGVESNEEKPYEKSEEQQEYLEDANDNTAAGNESPVQDGKSFTMLVDGGDVAGEEEEDDDDDPLTGIEIGDDPAESEKKLPVM